MNLLLQNPLTDNLNGVYMLKQSAITIPLFLTLACGPDTIVVIPQHSADLPVTELEYIEAPSIDEEQLFYAERIIFEEESSEEQPVQEEEQPVEEEQPEEEPVQEEPPVEEEPVQEEQPEEEPVEEEQPEEEPAQEEEPVEEEQVEEELPVEEEQQPEEEPVEEEQQEEEEAEESPFSGECELEGNLYSFQSICIYPLACLSRHVDNFQVVPETGFCGKMCFGHSNCPGDTQCVMNGVTPGVGYCELE